MNKERRTVALVLNQLYILGMFPYVLSGVVALLALLISDISRLRTSSDFFSEINPISVSLFLGFFVGLAFVRRPVEKDKYGTIFKKFLRLATILLGFKLSLYEVFSIGASTTLYILFSIGLVFVSAFVLQKIFKIEKAQALLLTVGTAICGISAVISTAAVIKAKKEDVSTAVTFISLYGFFSLFFFPQLAYFLFQNHELSVGVFLGLGIHDTAQVLGSSLIFENLYKSINVVDFALITKLYRNVFIIFLLPVVAHVFLNSSEKKTVKIKEYFPYFIILFLGLSLLRTLGDLDSNKAFGFIEYSSWKNILDAIEKMSTGLIAYSLAALGISTHFSTEFLKRKKVYLFGLALSICTALGIYSLLTVVKISGFF